MVLSKPPRQWNEKLSKPLIENGFEQSKCDYSLYVKSNGDLFFALLVYVDDIIITGNNNSEIDKVKDFLRSKFQIKDLRMLNYFLGIEVVETDSGVCLNQRKYCLELLNKFGYLGCKPLNTPMEVNLSFKSNSSSSKKLINIYVYQKLIGKLIYLTLTRLEVNLCMLPLGFILI